MKKTPIIFTYISILFIILTGSPSASPHNKAISAPSKILLISIDGGGMRGIIPSVLLQNVLFEKDHLLKGDNIFIAGSSTGSIIASGLAAGKTPSEILSYYELDGPKIFKKQIGPKLLRAATYPLYDVRNLNDVMKMRYQDLTLDRLQTNLIIPTFDIATRDQENSEGSVHVISSFNPDHKQQKVLNAVTASCSCPGFFDPHFGIDGRVLIDGGIVAKKTDTIAIAEIIRKYQDTLSPLEVLSRLRVLSFGTGHSRLQFKESQVKNRGLLSWSRQLPILMMNAADEKDDLLCSVILGKRYVRFEPVLESLIPMDTVSACDFVKMKHISQDYLMSDHGAEVLKRSKILLTDFFLDEQDNDVK